jgi:hypothetical protein
VIAASNLATKAYVDASAPSGTLSSASNLSDLANVTTARNNLGLGSANTVSFSNVNITGSYRINNVPLSNFSGNYSDLTGQPTQYWLPGVAGDSIYTTEKTRVVNASLELNRLIQFTDNNANNSGLITTSSSLCLFSKLNKYYIIDYDNTGINRSFFWKKGSSNVTQGTLLMELTNAGKLIVSGDINSDISAVKKLSFINENGSSYETTMSNAPVTDGVIMYYIPESNDPDIFRIEKTDQNTDVPDGRIEFTRRGKNGTSIVDMSIYNGNIGIGTSNPTEKLRVVGNGLFTSNVNINYITLGTTNVSTAGGGAAIVTPDNQPRLYFYNNGGTVHNISSGNHEFRTGTGNTTTYIGPTGIETKDGSFSGIIQASTYVGSTAYNIRVANPGDDENKLVTHVNGADTYIASTRNVITGGDNFIVPGIATNLKPLQINSSTLYLNTTGGARDIQMGNGIGNVFMYAPVEIRKNTTFPNASKFAGDGGAYQLMVAPASGNGRLAFSYDNASNESYIQSQIFGVGGKPLRLNYAGGDVIIGNSSVLSTLNIAGNMTIGSYVDTVYPITSGNWRLQFRTRYSGENTAYDIWLAPNQTDCHSWYNYRGHKVMSIYTNLSTPYTSGLFFNGDIYAKAANGGPGKIAADGNVSAGGVILTSDDRIKSDEVFIENATETLKKLRPQTYNKWTTIDYQNDSNATSVKESGIIAQEMFYDAPELRHLVTLPEGADSNALYSTTIQSSQDPSIDPDYKDWGSNIASVNYNGLIPYLIKAIQEKDEQIAFMQSNIVSLESRLTAGGL